MFRQSKKNVPYLFFLGGSMASRKSQSGVRGKWKSEVPGTVYAEGLKCVVCVCVPSSSNKIDS